MSDYVELYKRFRPRQWHDVVGQDRIVKSLRHSAATGTIPAAYGFFGPRGCGKTSVAFIMAKAVNCSYVHEYSGNPCNACDSCVAIDDNDKMGIHYMSMANYGGVDEIRSIVQQAWLHQPVHKQVWILDEVHNLSSSAFDSLLIPLEQENMPSLFILCSTAVEKVPSAVLSRLQQHKFNTVSTHTLSEYLTHIAEQDELTDYQQAVTKASQMSGGSVRDAVAYFESITHHDTVTNPLHGDIIAAVAEQDRVSVLRFIAQAGLDGEQYQDVTESMISSLRSILLATSGSDSSLYGSVDVPNPKHVIKQLRSTQRIIFMIEELGNALTNMNTGMDSRIALELALMKITGAFTSAEASA